MFFTAAGALFGFLGVALGAFAAHGLSDRLDERMLQVFKTGAEYQMYHALALLAIGLMLHKWPESALLNASGWAFVAGILLFSFSLYGLALTGIGPLGAITPLGGSTFLVGWACLFIWAFQYVR